MKRTILTPILLLALSLHFLAQAQFDISQASGVMLEGFKTRGTNSKGETEWELEGEKVRLRGGSYVLDGAKLLIHIEDGRKALITSSKCWFDNARGLARSDRELKVVSDEMVLEGVGYDLAIKTKMLRIRSKVKMKIYGISTSSSMGLPALGHTTKETRGDTVKKTKEGKKK